MAIEGWVHLHRILSIDPMWTAETFTRGQAWVDLIMLANHLDGYIRVRGVKVEIKRGQVGYSEVTLAKRWKWSRDKVRRWFKELEGKEEKIIQQKDNVSSVITLINYDKYQSNKTPNNTANRQQTIQQTDSKQDTNNNEKNDKNEKKKNIYSPDSPEIYLSNLLFVKISERDPLHKKPDLQLWGKDINALIRIDGRSSQEIETVICWCQEDQFWKNNILSTAKLRKKFSQLLLKSQESGDGWGKLDKWVKEENAKNAAQ